MSCRGAGWVLVLVLVLLRQVDHALAAQQAAALHAAGVQKLIGTDHDVFLEILGKSSRAQIQVRPALLFYNYACLWCWISW